VSDGVQTDVGIVGAGYAGMAAAVALARNGVAVTVYEAARQLGGRARAVARNGHVLDNGQHILIGAYRQTLAAIATVGVDTSALLRLPLTWTVLPDFSLRAVRLPPPWHLAVGLLRAKGMSLKARVACVQFMSRLQRMRFRLDADTNAAQLLNAHQQHAAAIRYLWEPLCIAALNTPLAQASAQVFLNVLRDGLAAERSASDLLLPRVDLGALFPEPAASYVRSHRGHVLLGAAVAGIEPVANGFHIHGAQVDARHRSVIIATPPHRVSALLSPLGVLAETLAPLAAMSYQPIVTVYSQYDAAPTRSFPMIGLSGATAQWLFDRGAIARQHGLIAAVISARAREQAPNHHALAQRVQADIAAVHPGLALPVWQQVIEEKRATFACTPGLQRVGPRTPIPGLFLAGDYTEPDYPATLEAAVRSGSGAAELARLALAVA
jgi:hydroxysqualene dehydroxylase